MFSRLKIGSIRDTTELFLVARPCGGLLSYINTNKMIKIIDLRTNIFIFVTVRVLTHEF